MRIIEHYFIVSLFILVMLVSFLIRDYGNYYLGSLFAFFSSIIAFKEGFELFRVIENESRYK